MQYVLGNMLNGGGINPDGLSLDLQFAADKTFSKPSSLAAGETAITSRRGPSATFLRSSGATEVGPDGLIRYAPENLIPQSQDFSSATWQKIDGATVGATVADPFGGNSAFTLIFSSASASRIEQLISSPIRSGDVVTVSVYLRADSNTTIFTRFGLESFAAFNVTTSWQRFSYTGIVSPIGLYPQLNNAFSGAKTIYAYGFQVERHPTARTYIPTTTAAVYGPRFDHDPVTLACKGLLIEEGRTNSVADSNSFNNWLNLNSTVATSSVVTPEGTANAWKVAEDSILNIHTVSRAFTAVSGTTYTASVWLKPAENGFAFVGLAGGGFVSTFISVNLSTGAVSTALGTPIGASSVSHSNGWWRVSFSLAATASLSSIIAIRLSRDGNWANSSYLGNGVNGMYVYGAQVEAGSFPTSYIPTTTGTLARGADVCSITGGNFNNFYNQPEGTLFVDVTPQTVDQNAFVFGVNTTTFNSSHGIYKTNATVTAAGKRWICLTFDTSTQTEIATPTDIAVSRSRLAYAYKINDYAFAYAGGIVGTDTSATVPSPTAMRIGSRDDGRFVNGHLASIRYYKKRLPNAKLVQLTV
jgi:hypothetical protein